MMHLNTTNVKNRLLKGTLNPDELLDPSKVKTALADPSSTFLEFVGMYYSLMLNVASGRNKLKALSMLPGGFSPKEQTAAILLNYDHPGCIESMTSLDADRPTLERLRSLFKQKLGEASFLDHLVEGQAQSMPFLDETFDLGIMNHGIDDILTAKALKGLGHLRFEYHPPKEREVAHARACKLVGKQVKHQLKDGSRAVLSAVKNAMAKLTPGGIFAFTNYPSHHFAYYDDISEGKGYYHDMVDASNACFADALEWAETDTASVKRITCEVNPFALGYTFNGNPQIFSGENIGVIQKT